MYNDIPHIIQAEQIVEKDNDTPELTALRQQILNVSPILEALPPVLKQGALENVFAIWKMLLEQEAA